MERPTAIELFSGCGGMSSGLLDAGYDVRLGVDHDRPSVDVFEYNHAYRGSRSLLADVAALSGHDLLSSAGVASVDLLVGGPPCQPFSIVGKRLGLADPRAQLIQEYLRLICQINPRAVIFENVPSLISAHDGAVIDDIEAQLTSMGYRVKYGILNAADYGVPQNRKRLILVAVRGRSRFPFPPGPTHAAIPDLFHAPYVTCRDALSDLPDVEEPAAAAIPNHVRTQHTPRMTEAFARLAPGKRDPGSYHDRLHPDRPGYTLRAGSGNFSPLRPVHYLYNRVISVRESARLQGFSDSFIWPDSISRLQQYRQVGNAVPPPLARVVGAFIAYLQGWALDPDASLGNPNDRPNGLLLTPEELRDRRMRYHRGGASFGKRKAEV